MCEHDAVDIQMRCIMCGADCTTEVEALIERENAEIEQYEAMLEQHPEMRINCVVARVVTEG